MIILINNTGLYIVENLQIYYSMKYIGEENIGMVIIYMVGKSTKGLRTMNFIYGLFMLSCGCTLR